LKNASTVFLAGDSNPENTFYRGKEAVIFENDMIPRVKNLKKMLFAGLLNINFIYIFTFDLCFIFFILNNHVKIWQMFSPRSAEGRGFT